MASLPDYTELLALSNFSFLQGASHPEELLQRALALGYRGLALTESPTAHREAETAKAHRG